MSGQLNGQSSVCSTVRIAAVQARLRAEDVGSNLRRIADLARSAAREHAPQLLLLPEAMTSPNVFTPGMLRVPRPADGEPLEVLTGLARELDCVVGGGYVAVRRGDAYGTYALVEPDGTAHFHDKDMPSLWENALYRDGRDDGLVSTGLGDLGCAVGFEWARSATARRLRGRAAAVVGGSCWWSYPDWPLVRGWFGRDHQYNLLLARDVFAGIARAVGAPVAVSQHVGEMRSRTPLMPGVPWRTILIGETQIVAHTGEVLRRMTYEDGEGHVGADVAIGPHPARDHVPDAFWLRPMPASVHLVWHQHRLHGRTLYRWRKARHRFPWQDETSGADLVTSGRTGAARAVSQDRAVLVREGE